MASHQESGVRGEEIERPWIELQGVSDSRIVGEGLETSYFAGNRNAGFRLSNKLSHRVFGEGYLYREVLAYEQKWNRSLKASQKGMWRGRVAGGKEGSSLWISMSSGRLGKSLASSSRGIRFSFFMRW